MDVGTVLTERLVWHPNPAIVPFAMDLADYFGDVTDER